MDREFLKEILVRSLSGLFFAFFLLIMILFAPLWLLLVVISLLSGVAMWEFLKIVLGNDFIFWKNLSYMLLSMIAPFFLLIGFPGVIAGMGFIFIGGVFFGLIDGDDLEKKLYLICKKGWGLFYTSGLIMLLVSIIFFPFGRLSLVSVLLIVMAADTGSYFVGSFWGKRKLVSKISPGKTWEGFIGGLLCAGLMGGLLFFFKIPNISVLFGVLGGIFLGLFAVIGDILESIIKRVYGVKDSGFLIPGHGGILDRIDGLLIAGPLVFIIRILLF